MAVKALIIQNLTSSPLPIDDLGIYIPANGMVDITFLFANNRAMPFESAILRDFIGAGSLALNNGITTLGTIESLQYLEMYMVAEHSIINTHAGDLLESSISPDGIIARTNFPSTIMAPWQLGVGGSLAIEAGDALPAEDIVAGRVFWDAGDKKLYAGAGNVWNNILVTQNSRYNAPVIYEYGQSGTLNSGAYLSTAWAKSNITPVIVPLNGTLKSICATSTSTRSYTCAIRRLVGSTWTTIASVNAATAQYNAYNNNLAVNFDAGDKLACYVSAGRMDNPHCYIEVTWRL